ncbi:MAG: hypothetical protein QXI12_13460, partial [Candidatus Methanomethyliaceae archaeon]
VSFCLLVFGIDAPEALLFLHVATFIIFLHATPQILYGTLRYSWAWKHVGIIDYIQRHGTVNPEISYLGAYHNWPGFFALNALITEIAGGGSALSYAGWAPAFFNLIDLGALVFIYKTFTRDRRLIWLSVWFFFLSNWVGQDYFSPQAMVSFMYLVILAICLRWFRSSGVPMRPTLRLPRSLDRLVEIVYRVIGRATPAEGIAAAPDRPGLRVGLMIIVIMLLIVVASSHQLTPLMTISALAALVLSGLCAARGLPVLMTVLTATWIMYMAVAFLNGNLRWVITSIGLLTSNFSANLINLAQASPGQVLVAWMDRGLSAMVWVMAILGCMRRIRNGYWDLPAVLLAFSPFPMIAANSYGGEIVFRVYFFGLPFAVFLAAALVYPDPKVGLRLRTAMGAIALSALLLVGLLFAYYGKERQYYFTPEEVAAAEYFQQVAPPGAMLMDASWNWPLHYKNYEFYDYFSLVTMSKNERLELLRDPVGVIRGLMEERPNTYLVFTRSQKAYIDMTGVMPAGSLDAIERALMASDQFGLAFANRHAKIFVLARNGIGN